MKQSDVVVGGTYVTKVSGVHRRVIVMRATTDVSPLGKKYTRYVVRRESEFAPLPKWRTAAALEPVQ